MAKKQSDSKIAVAGALALVMDRYAYLECVGPSSDRR
jgi:hypothetical protein